MQSDALLARGGCSWHRSPKGGLAQLRVTSSCSTCTAQQYMQNKRLAQTHFVDLYKAEPFTCQNFIFRVHIRPMVQQEITGKKARSFNMGS